MLNGYELKFPSKDIANALYSQPNYKDLKGQKVQIFKITLKSSFYI
ncbi:MAG: hypothetical protein MR481_07040 [Campylobacter sp.]|nr:hypothetical protein [Campylobacter sp.]MCI7247661.1 hypothetical protein [Campylobacter sp.]